VLGEWVECSFVYVCAADELVGGCDRPCFFSEQELFNRVGEAVHLCKEFLWPLTGILLQGSE
jgi:hypothetical protein